MRVRLVSLSIAAAALFLGACTTTRQARSVTPSGFLGESSALLERGKSGDEALLVYRNKSTAWRSYDKIILKPVTIWKIADSTLTPEQLADYQTLVDSFNATLLEKLSRTYQLTPTAAPGTLRIEAAIVNAAQAIAPLKVAKTIAPYGGVADFLWTFATGKPAFSGEVSIEYMIRDSQSDELLAAGVDKRVGGNQLGKATFSNWGDVRNILTYWSDTMVYSLCVDRAAGPCEKPRAGILER